MPNGSIPAAAEGMPGPNSPDHPWNKARRLAKELSEALDECDGGKQMAEVYPSKIGDRPPVFFGDITHMDESARGLLHYHARGFGRAARHIDPTATEIWMGEGMEPSPQRFMISVSRKMVEGK